MSSTEACEQEIYCYNRAESSVIGIWDSISDEPGWYWVRYQMGPSGDWEEVDGGLWTREYDAEGNLVSGYATCREAYEDVAWDGDEPCLESLFEAVEDIVRAQFGKRQAESLLDECAMDLDRELYSFLAAA